MRLRLLAAAISVAIAAPWGAVANHTCDTDPECNGGRGSLPGYVCIRSEVNNIGNEFNGRICYPHPRGVAWYVYLRAIVNRDWVVVCREEQLIASVPQPSFPEVCEYPPGAH